jgi:hypothetical protein
LAGTGSLSYALAPVAVATVSEGSQDEDRIPTDRVFAATLQGEGYDMLAASGGSQLGWPNTPTNRRLGNLVKPKKSRIRTDKLRCQLRSLIRKNGTAKARDSSGIVRASLGRTTVLVGRFSHT